MDTLLQTKARRGRPPSFDRNAALRQAMRLFWDYGYEGTTFEQLTTAMGISASSFQNAFGSKQALYAEATNLYLEEKAAWFATCMAEAPDTRSAFEALITSAARSFTEGDMPAGCMVSIAGMHADPIREMLVSQRALTERVMRERLEQGMAAGELPPDTDAGMFAAFFNTVLRGMAVQARDGATREKLEAIGRQAMRSWPAP